MVKDYLLVDVTDPRPRDAYLFMGGGFNKRLIGESKHVIYNHDIILSNFAELNAYVSMISAQFNQVKHAGRKGCSAPSCMCRYSVDTVKSILRKTNLPAVKDIKTKAASCEVFNFLAHENAIIPKQILYGDYMYDILQDFYYESGPHYTTPDGELVLIGSHDEEEYGDDSLV